MFEPFKFQIESVDDVCPDTNEVFMAHHFTSLIGRIREGTIRIDQRIAIPAKNGTMLVARVVLLEAFHRQVDEVSHNGQIGIFLWGSSVRYDEVEIGFAEWFQADLIVDILDRLWEHPQLYLHNIPETGELCSECLRRIARQPGGIGALQEMMHQSDAEVAELAQRAIRCIEHWSVS